MQLLVTVVTATFSCFRYAGSMKYISLYGLADRRMQFPTNLPYFQFLYNFSERRDYEKSLRDYESGGFPLSIGMFIDCGQY